MINFEKYNFALKILLFSLQNDIESKAPKLISQQKPFVIRKGQQRPLKATEQRPGSDQILVLIAALVRVPCKATHSPSKSAKGRPTSGLRGLHGLYGLEKVNHVKLGPSTNLGGQKMCSALY